MNQVFKLLKQGKPVPKELIEAIEGYEQQLGELQDQFIAQNKPYVVRYEAECYIMKRLTKEELLASDMDNLQQYAEQPDMFARSRAASEREREKLVEKGLLKPKKENE